MTKAVLETSHQVPALTTGQPIDRRKISRFDYAILGRYVHCRVLSPVGWPSLSNWGSSRSKRPRRLGLNRPRVTSEAASNEEFIRKEVAVNTTTQTKDKDFTNRGVLRYTPRILTRKGVYFPFDF